MTIPCILSDFHYLHMIRYYITNNTAHSKKHGDGWKVGGDKQLETMQTETFR